MEINERAVEKAANELNKYAFFYSLKEHTRARGSEGGVAAPRSYPSLEGLKSAVKSGRLRPGETVDVEGFLSPFISMHRPRAYYPEMFLGDLRATAPGESREDGAEGASCLPHVLPVVRLPGLPDGWEIRFLYPASTGLFQHYEHPHRLMDVLTRDYLRIPVLLPPGDYPAGMVRFRARLLEMRPVQLEEFVHLDARESDAYTMRGLTLFLEASGEGWEAEPDGAPCGSLFVETRIKPLSHTRAEAVLEEALANVAEELFPATYRGDRKAGLDIDHETGHHFLRYRQRLFALIYRPFIAVYRAPHFLSLYLPTLLDEAALADREEVFDRAFSLLEEEMVKHGVVVEGGLPVDFVHDPRLPAWRDREALRNSLIERVVEERPYLSDTVHWLRGG